MARDTQTQHSLAFLTYSVTLLLFTNYLILHFCPLDNRVHSHLNDRSRICSCVRRSERIFMARSVGAHVSASRLRLGSSCLQRQSKCCCLVEKSGSSQRLQAYRSSISLCSGLRVILGKIGLEKISTTDNVFRQTVSGLFGNRWA